MASLYTLSLSWQGRTLKQQLEAATQEPELAQARLLHQLLSRHGDTQFGREHRFARERSLLGDPQLRPPRYYPAPGAATAG